MKFQLLSRLRWGLAAVFAALFLASCVVVEEGPRPLPPGPGPGFPPPQACTMQYDPVCGERGRDRQTFGNACQARAEGYRIVSAGECRRGGGQGERPQACTREYAPVCAQRGRDRQTFGNACVARSEGFDPVYDGECRESGRPGPGGPGFGGPGAGGPGFGGPGFGGRPGGGNQQVCTREYAPVCARRGGQVRTFGNQCEADSAGFQTIARGECR